MHAQATEQLSYFPCVYTLLTFTLWKPYFGDKYTSLWPCEKKERKLTSEGRGIRVPSNDHLSEFRTMLAECIQAQPVTRCINLQCCGAIEIGRSPNALNKQRNKYGERMKLPR